MKDHDIKSGSNTRAIARWLMALAMIGAVCGVLAWFFFKKMKESGF